MGANTKISYGNASNDAYYVSQHSAVYPMMDMQPAINLVTKVDADNGIGGINSVQYRYEGFKVNLLGRGSLGFEKRTATSISANNVAIANSDIYAQKFPFVGEPLISESRLLANNQLLSRNENQFSCIDRTGRLLGYGACASFAANDTPIFPFVSTNKFITELTDDDLYGVNTIEKIKNLTYDLWGNVVQLIETTHGGGESFSSDQFSTFGTTENQQWQGLLSRQTITATSQTTSGFKSLSRTRQFTYTAQGLMQTETVEPDDASLKLLTNYTYNNAGQLLTKFVSGQGLKTQTTSYLYESTLPLRLSRQTNGLGHQNNFQYTDTRFPWLPTEVADANGLITKVVYNGFAQKMQTLQSSASGYQNLQALDFKWCNACGIDSAVFYSVKSSATAADVYTYFDVMGRQIYQWTAGFNKGIAEKVITRQFYNELGLPYRISEPFFESQLPVYTESTYDNLSRIKTVTRPDGAISYVSYYGLQTTNTNPLGQVQVINKNAIGQTIQTTDDNSSTLQMEYDPFGNLTLTRDANGNQVKVIYDRLGRKTKLDDPDQGIWTYTYNPDGTLKSQTDAKGQTTTMQYDVLGRMTKRTDADGLISNWLYDSGNKAIGKLSSENSSNGLSRSYVYDNLGRLVTSNTSIDGQTYTQTTSYDSLSRVVSTTYPTGVVIQNSYNTQLGFLEKIFKQGTSIPLWTAKSFDARGQLEQFKLGSNIDVENDHQLETGRLQDITAFAGPVELIRQRYQWDDNGNLDAKWDYTSNVQEDFTYDNLNRLTNVTTAGAYTSSTSIQYDALGNIINKSDVGSYNQYGGTCNNIKAGPHAVTGIIGKGNYCYDKNGNMLTGAGRSLQYTSANTVAKITQGTQNSSFKYGPNRERFKRVDSTSAGTTTTYYLGNYEKVVSGSTTIHKIYVGDFAQLEQTGSTQTLEYYIRDHLGSLIAITDSVGNIKQRLSFDAWGKRRALNASYKIDLLSFSKNYTTRGFTNHEHIDTVGLIHMNGRVFDPTISRFVSADPFIQAPNNLQSYSRYSYVMNNPLAYTDPTGYRWKYLRPLLAIGIGFINPGAWLASNSILAGAITGGIAGGVGTGSSKGALIGAFTGGVLGGIHMKFDGLAKAANLSGQEAIRFGSNSTLAFQKLLAHGMTGGVNSLLSGGKFGHGFASMGLTQAAALGGLFDSNGVFAGRAGNAIGASIIGGSASVVAGGNFAEGAVQAVMSHFLNDLNFPEKLKVFRENMSMAFDWAAGSGENYRTFGADSFQSLQMQDSPGVNAARSYYIEKFSDALCSNNLDLTGMDVTNFKGSFGVKEFISATYHMDATEHFVGSYGVEIYGGKSRTMNFRLTNNSSFKSFAYGMAPAWERSTMSYMGNMRQTYSWTERY